MKNIYASILILATMLSSTVTFAQSPEKFSYQAVVRDASDNLLQNKNVGIRVSILKQFATGTPVYVETQVPTTNTNGLFTVEIGTGNVVSGDISTIDWSDGPYFIKTEIDPAGGSNYTISGTSEFLSVPYALHAKTAETVLGGITETDPVFTASPANGISSGDITSWDNKLDTEVDGSVTNELQTISKSGNTVTLSNGGGSFTDAVNDADANATNEIQTLSLNGQIITLSNGGGTVTIPSSNSWGLTGNSGTTPGTNFIGTTDNKAIIFKANNAYVGKISPGTGDIFLGGNAGNSATGNATRYNVGIGSESLGSVNSFSYNNTAIGYQSLKSIIFQDENVAIGSQALKTSSGSQNTAVGTFSLRLSTTGSNNATLGFNTLRANTTGNNNSAIGNQSMYNNTTGIENTAVGSKSLFSNSVTNGLTAIGYKALYANTTGTYNVAVGHLALTANVSGIKNSAFGTSALKSNTGGSYNSAFGFEALKTSSSAGFYNSAYGALALTLNTSGDYNTANGYRALISNTSGNSNCGIGMNALYKNSSASYNTALGVSSLYNNTTGYRNTAVGFTAFYSGATYHNSTGIGFNSEPGANNRVRLGNSSVSSIGGYTNWTNVSDGKLKTNVKENIVGLDFIMKLRPVSYNLDMDAIAQINNTPDSLRLFEDEALKAAEIQTGFIAQEVEAAAQEIGFEFHGVEAPKNANDHYGLRYAEFVVPLVKGMQEQQVVIENQNKNIKNLETENNQLKKNNEEMKKTLDLLIKRVENLENN